MWSTVGHASPALGRPLGHNVWSVCPMFSVMLLIFRRGVLIHMWVFHKNMIGVFIQKLHAPRWAYIYPRIRHTVSTLVPHLVHTLSTLCPNPFHTPSSHSPYTLRILSTSAPQPLGEHLPLELKPLCATYGCFGRSKCGPGLGFGDVLASAHTFGEAAFHEIIACAAFGSPWHVKVTEAFTCEAFRELSKGTRSDGPQSLRPLMFREFARDIEA